MGLVRIVRKDDGYWLYVEGKTKKAQVNLGEHGPVVLEALREVAEDERSAVDIDKVEPPGPWPPPPEEADDPQEAEKRKELRKLVEQGKLGDRRRGKMDGK